MEDTALFQLIDGDSKLSADLPTFLSSSGFPPRGTDYNVIAVLGPQSSGKSTLLNTLFGTKFATLNANTGRQQTTKGVWLSTVKKQLLVLDVEGTDSKERAEDGFERKSSLLSVAIAEVVIVNMWYTDLGRYTASNFALLKTVFEVNLQLFAKKGSPKTLLVFVIRDHVETETPLNVVEKNLHADMATIWASITKKDEFKESLVTQFFDFAFVSFPHFVYRKDEFGTAAAGFAKRLLDRGASDFLFADQYRKAVPIDGFPHYVGEIWKAIVESKDLDIPTQKEMLANFRCEEITAELLESFGAALAPAREIVNNARAATAPEAPAKVGGIFTSALAATVEAFDQETSSYHAEVVARKRADLLARLEADVDPLYRALLAVLRAAAFTSLRAAVEKDLPRNAKRAQRGFGARSARLVEEATAGFVAHARAACPSFPGVEAPSHAVALEELSESCATFVLAERKAQVEALHAEVEADVARLLDEDLAGLLEAMTPTMWKDVQELHDSVASAVRSTFTAALAESFSPSAEERSAFEASVNAAVAEHLRKGCLAAVGGLVVRLKARFDRRFKLDDEGVPRMWPVGEDVRAVFVKARDEVAPLVDTFTEMKVDTAAQVDRKILSAKKREDILAQFNQEIETSFVDAQRAQEANNRPSNIPWWIYAALVVLGWNEFYMLLTSPLFLLTLIALIGAAVFGVGEGIHPVSDMAISFVRNTLHSFVNDQTAQPQRVNAHPPTAPAASQGNAPSSSTHHARDEEKKEDAKSPSKKHHRKDD